MRVSKSPLLLWMASCLLPVLSFASPAPPTGFRALFNGENLTGWYGLNPHAVGKLEGEKRVENLAKQRAEFAQHWRVEDGELVNGGAGPYATTEEEFGNIELLLEYKTVAGADSGIYLRGVPQKAGPPAEARLGRSLQQYPEHARTGSARARGQAVWRMERIPYQAGRLSDMGVAKRQDRGGRGGVGEFLGPCPAPSGERSYHVADPRRGDPLAQCFCARNSRHGDAQVARRVSVPVWEGRANPAPTRRRQPLFQTVPPQ